MGAILSLPQTSLKANLQKANTLFMLAQVLQMAHHTISSAGIFTEY